MDGWISGSVHVKLLGGLSLHLNHLIGSQAGNYDWQFGTLHLDFLVQKWVLSENQSFLDEGAIA